MYIRGSVSRPVFEAELLIHNPFDRSNFLAQFVVRINPVELRMGSPQFGEQLPAADGGLGVFKPARIGRIAVVNSKSGRRSAARSPRHNAQAPHRVWCPGSCQ